MRGCPWRCLRLPATSRLTSCCVRGDSRRHPRQTSLPQLPCEGCMPCTDTLCARWQLQCRYIGGSSGVRRLEKHGPNDHASTLQFADSRIMLTQQTSVAAFPVFATCGKHLQEASCFDSHAPKKVIFADCSKNTGHIRPDVSGNLARSGRPN